MPAQLLKFMPSFPESQDLFTPAAVTKESSFNQEVLRGLNLERLSRSSVSALLEISFSLLYSSGIRQRTARRWGRWAAMRHINGTTMAQCWGLSGAAAAASRGKVSNISNFCEKCCGIFFWGGTILPPMALISGKRPGKNK